MLESPPGGGQHGAGAEVPIPLTPVLSARTLSLRTTDRDGAIAHDPHRAEVLRFVSGRYALLRILRDIGIGPGDEILLPAYHCPALLGPVQALDAVAVLYHVDPHLDPQLADLRARISPRTRALIVVHYFGFWRELAPLRALLDGLGAVLIEDCAHIFPPAALAGAGPSGGDFRFGSYMKFAPTFDGGFATSRRHWRTWRADSAPHAGAELRAGLTLLERAAAVRRLGWLSRPVSWLLQAKDKLWAALKRRQRPGETAATAAAVYGGYALDLQFADQAPTRLGRWLYRHLDWELAAARRRSHYAELARGLAGSAGIQLLQPDLGPDDVPYVLPLLAESGDELYARLKARGIPLYRWDEMEPGPCAVANRYARQLLQVPCHQDLQPGDLRRIVAAFHSTADAIARH